MKDITDGIKLYFNETLGTRLLYESERSQYEQVVEPHLDNEQPSEIYGAEHLMRLFTEFGGLLSCMSTDQEDLSLLTGHLEDVLKYAYVQYMLRVVLKITQVSTLFLGILQKMKLVFLVMTVILHQRLVKTGLLFNTISIA